ncbi:putative pentatricopeptide repeat-containing protein [Sesamum alatum]|uniref:Pentatricopeptide repeat-containing protein n=1 Tax=Sesamum alatum TaxID=300844 RepID=A0AAE2CEI4_9LAMI|nr:putative pentatricopeptide repeat-containing protein [Sesamum alatum]
MFSPRDVVSSSRRLFCKYVYANPIFSSLGKVSAFPSKSVAEYHIHTSFDVQIQAQVRPENHCRKAGILSEGAELGFSHKYDFLIEKYRFSRSGFEARRFHSDVIKNGFVGDLFMGNTLINVYARSGDLVSAKYVFDEMPDKNSVTWACLITGYTQNEMPENAIAAFGRMVSAGFIPNHYALGSALRACQRLGAEGLKHGTQIHGLVSKTRYAFDVVVCNALISMYGSCVVGSTGSDHAWRVFDGIENKNSISWNSIISVYSQRGDVVSVFGLFSDMQKEGLGFNFRPSEYTFGSLITAAAESLNVDHGSLLLKQLLAKVEMSGFVEDLFVGSALVSSFARLGSIDIAKSIFQQMGTRNAVSLNGLMVGLVKLKQGEEAVEVFLDTRELVKLNFDSYVLLLSAFGEFSYLDEGRRKGKEVSWNSIIRAFTDSEASIVEGTRYFIEMMRAGRTPNSVTFINILAAAASLSCVQLTHQVHALVLKYRLTDDKAVNNSLLTCYGKSGEINDCETDIGSKGAARTSNSSVSGFGGSPRAPQSSELTKHGKQNIYSWNSIISGYARHGDGHKALRCFQRRNWKTSNQIT